MKTRYKVGDIVRILPGYREDPAMKEEEAIREIIYVDETDEELPYQLDGDDDFRLKWWGDDMLEKYEPLFTLTPEEVELVKIAIEMSIEISDAIVECVCGADNEPVPNGFQNLLTRIEKYQDAYKTGK